MEYDWWRFSYQALGDYLRPYKGQFNLHTRDLMSYSKPKDLYM